MRMRWFVDHVADKSGLAGFIEGAYTRLESKEGASGAIGEVEGARSEALQSEVVLWSWPINYLRNPQSGENYLQRVTQ